MQKHAITLENNEEIAYLKSGEGKEVIILLHGNMNAGINWDIFLNHCDEDFTCYAPDLRGFGDSSYETQITSIKDFSEDIKRFATALNLKHFTLVGWSLGGNVAMQYTIDYPEDVKTLILMASGSIKGFPIRKRILLGFFKSKHYITTLDDMKKTVKPIERLKRNHHTQFIKRLFNRSLYSHTTPDEETYNTYIEAMIKQRNLAEVNLALSYFNISDVHNGVTDGNNLVNSIDCPVLIIHGSEDKVVPVSVAEDNYEALKETATLEILEGVSHAPLLDEQDKVIQSIQSFIKT